MLIQASVEKLNGDLHQPSEIRYESRSFSVICLVSLAYRKGLISGVNLFVVVPQAIGISLRNTSTTTIAMVLVKDNPDGQEHVIYYATKNLMVPSIATLFVTEINSYGLGYHNR